MIHVPIIQRGKTSTNPAHVPDPVGERIAELEDVAITAGSLALRAYPGEFGVKVAASIVRRFAKAIDETRGLAA